MRILQLTPLFFLFLLAGRPPMSWGAPERKVGLEESFRAALKQSETVAGQAETVLQAEERYSQAKGSILPTVNAVGSYTRQEAPNRPIGGTISPSSQPLLKLMATQPLFRGLREFAALRQTDVLRGAESEALRQAKRQLFMDVSQSTFTILSLEKDLANLKAESEVYEKRAAELRSRVRIGRSRVSEVLTVETAISNLKAQVEGVSGQLRVAREAYAFLTGLSAETLLEAPQVALAPPAPLEGYLSQLESRPDVLSARSRVAAAEQGVSIAKGAHLPTVDLIGNYYLKRYGVNEDIKWDFQVAATLPLFAGGVIQSQVRQAESVQKQVELNLQRVRRQGDQEIRTLHQALEADFRQWKALQQATELAERNYQQQTKEYRLGLVTNIDVLSALTAFEESQRALDRASFAIQLDFMKLDALSGKVAVLEKGN